MSIEKGLAQSNDSFQMMYLRDYEYTETEILVIENNPTLAMEIQKILKKIGFQKIYLSKNGEEGIKIFSELCNIGKITPIIIDDKVSDKNIKEIVKEILSIHPGANIIVESSNAPTDPQIKELFDMGVVSHIYKPLKFDDIKKSITEIEKEQIAINVNEEGLDSQLKNLLKSYKKISKKKILNSLNFKPDEIEQGLERLEFAQKITPSDEIKQAVCNVCNSGNITQTSSCPECSSVNIFHRTLLECLKCKHTFEQKFEGMDECPECRHALNRKGVDFTKLENNYYCTECTNSQSELKYMLECWNCQNKFEQKDAKWENTPCYKIKS
jgi:response regulator of citrate/malate metabolism